MAIYEVTFKVTEECVVQIEADNEFQMQDLFYENPNEWWQNSHTRDHKIEMEDYKKV